MKFERQTYTQTPNSLFLAMKDMDECELKVVMLICRYTFGYHRDEVKLSTRRIADEIGMNTASVQKGADRAVERGLIEKIIDGNKTTLWRALVSDSENESPMIQKMNRGVSDNESLSRIKESNKEKKDMLDMLLEQEQVAQPIRNACLAFENALLGSTVSVWPWDSTSKWQKFAKWVAAQDPAHFQRYAEWRKGDGKFHAMSNNKIRQDPQMFMDTGWPTFLAHVSMYQSKDKSFGL